MNDFVPPEIAAGNLQNDIFEKPRPQQARRAAALTGADAHRHVEFLVEIGHPQLKAFPHVGRKRPEGHAADHERIDLPNRWDPPVFRHELEALLRRQHPPQKRAQLEFVPSGIQRRIGQHGNPDKFDHVQQAAGIVAAPPPAARLSPPVDVHAQLVDFITVHGNDGIIGADHVAHGAPDAGIGRIGLLADAVIQAVFIFGGLELPHGRHHLAFAKDTQLNRIDRAAGRAPATERAFIFIPCDLPGQILDAQ